MAVSRLRTKIGVGIWLAFLAVMMWARTRSHQLDRQERVTRANLPVVGTVGTLGAAEGKPLETCPPDPATMVWPCKAPHVLAAGSSVKVMKADVVIDQALCRYWAQGGPDDRYVGDGLCAWFHPS
jgi:hypothetical protein